MKPPLVSLPNQTSFDTSMAVALVLGGNNTEGAIEFKFFTPSNHCYSTLIGPQLSAQLAQSLDQALSSMPQAPKVSKGGMFNAKVPGPQTTEPKTVRYFEQDYPADIVTTLGVLMIRVNLIERDMVDLFSAISGLSFERSNAILHSTRNMEARVDMIRAATPLAAIPHFRKEEVSEALDKLRRLFAQRNHLIHGLWTFKGDKFLVELFEPNGKTRTKETHVSVKSLEELASKYRSTGFMLKALADTVRLGP